MSLLGTAALAATLGFAELNALLMVGVLSAAIAWLVLFDQARRVSMGYLAATAVLAVLNVALTRAVHRCYLVTGAYAVRNSATEANRSLLNWLAAGAQLGPDDWAEHKQPTEWVSAEWAALAAECSPHIVHEPLPTEPGQPVPPPKSAAARPSRTIAGPSPA